MIRKILFFVLLCAVLLLALAPAALLDTGLRRASGGALGVAQAEGTLWQGRGLLQLQNGTAGPVLPLVWRFEPAGLLGGELRWQGLPESALRGSFGFGAGGVALHDARLEAPAGLLLSAMPGALAHAGWQGDLKLQAGDWRCSADGECRGGLRLQWFSAGSALLPGQRLGDYELQVAGLGKQLDFTLATLAGEVRLEGRGGVGTDGRDLHFDGRVAAPPKILGMLPGIGDGVLRDDGRPGSLAIRYPQAR